MKRIFFIGFILILAAGCTEIGDKGSIDKSGAKYCETKEDCVIKYNVLYNGECSAGCFNTESKVDSQCNSTTKWEPFAPNKTCVCENNKCIMKEKTSYDELENYPPQTKELCESGGAEYAGFNTGCHDECVYERWSLEEPFICTQALSSGCDCGQDKCWNGIECESN